MNFEISRLDVHRVRPLRHAILRPSAPLIRSEYPGDEAETTRHFGALAGCDLLGVATLIQESHPRFSTHRCWRLRGVAVHPTARRQGIGTALVKACLEYVAAQGGGLVWCFARVNALEFYFSLDFEKSEIRRYTPDGGEHLLLFHQVEAIT